MSVFDRLAGRYAPRPKDRELALAQARSFIRQAPVLYAILVTNSILLALTQSAAPAMLRYGVPCLLIVGCLVRLGMWWSKRHRDLTGEQAMALLTSTTYVAISLSVGFSAWALALYPYGDAFQQAHVVFYMAVTSICCMFCLSYLRTAAVLSALGALVPFFGVFATSGNAVLVVLAINLLLITLALLAVVAGNSRDFAALVASRGEMARRQDEARSLHEENDRLARLDGLTGLPNRHSFHRELQTRLDAANASGARIIVARLDLDSFKSVNDIFGHAAGDRVLQEVATRARAFGGYVARLDNDQFGLIGDELASPKHLAAWGEMLCEAMRRPFVFAEMSLHVTASAGLAMSQPGDGAEALFDRADYVTSVAKREARGSAVVFTDRHEVEIARVRAMEHALHTADLDKEIYVLFQPQFDISLDRVTGYEVLARWRSPVLGEVSPADFIPMAEQTGIVPKITQAVVRKALAVIDRLPPPLRLSVNLSAHDVSSMTAIEGIVSLIGQSGTPCRIDFEITETALMGDLQQANAALLALLALGSRIALDDFGTGHSSLTHVQKLPLDRIKIDRSFVAVVTSDATSRAIIKTTIDLCRNLGVSCVFEGIENEEQLEALLGLGGSVMQGYLFGRPMSQDMMLEKLSSPQPGWQASRNRMFGSGI